MNVNQSITWQKTGVVHQKSVIVIFKTQFCHKFNQFWRKYNSTGLNFSHVAKNTTFHALHILVHLLHHVHEALCFGNWCLAFGTILKFYLSICLSHPLFQPTCFHNMLAIFQVNKPEIKYCDCSYLQWHTIFTYTHTGKQNYLCTFTLQICKCLHFQLNKSVIVSKPTKLCIIRKSWVIDCDVGSSDW